MELEKQEKFRRGIEHFNCGEFFICHEVLEDIWLTEAPAEKPFYQGLIQTAAAFHHLQRGNCSGAASLLAAGLQKLEDFPAVYHGLHLEELRAWLRVCLDSLRAESSAAEAAAVVPPTIRWVESPSD